MKELGQLSREIGDKIAKAQEGLPELHRLKDILENHRVDTLIKWVKGGIKRDEIKEYMELSWKDYGLCDPACFAKTGEDCCHQFEEQGIKFCSPC